MLCFSNEPPLQYKQIAVATHPPIISGRVHLFSDGHNWGKKIQHIGWLESEYWREAYSSLVVSFGFFINADVTIVKGLKGE